AREAAMLVPRPAWPLYRERDLRRSLTETDLGAAAPGKVARGDDSRFPLPARAPRRGIGDDDEAGNAAGGARGLRIAGMGQHRAVAARGEAQAVIAGKAAFRLR